MRRILTSTIACTACFTAIDAAAWAQTEAETGSIQNAGDENGLSVYSKAYFDQFSPVTALDMVQRIPGFSLSDGDTSRRGLGDSFGNVLINGARPSNKSLSLDTVLQRIRVADVERLELIQEAQPDYNMRGHSRLVNVIMRDGAGSSGSWDARVEMSPSGRLGTFGTASYSTTAGPVELTFGLDVLQHGDRIRRRFARTDASNVLTEIQHDNDQRTRKRVEPTVSLNWQVDERSSLRLDLQLGVWTWGRRQVSFIDEPVAGGSRALRFQQNATQNHGNYQIGSATYALDLSENLSIQSIGLIRRDMWDDGPEAYEVYDPGTGFLGAVIVEAGGRSEETAVRQTLNWTPNERNTLELGAEFAVNARDTHLALFEDDGANVTPIELPVANTRVEETRSEVFINHTWTINDQLSLDSGLRYEFSEIVQTGDAEQSRSFAYPKPSVTLNWRQDDNNRLRLTARRDVDQLDFEKFTSSVNVSDSSTSIGNPDYVPQRTWTLEAEWERRFGDETSFSLRAGYDWIEDLDGWVPIVTPDGIFDAPGNIGDGTNLRVSTAFTTPLDVLGLSNAVLDVSVDWSNTNVEDPLTGEDRHFTDPREWDLGLDFRQTFPSQQIAWGVNYEWRSAAEEYRAREYHVSQHPDGDFDFYVETTRWGGVTTRLGVNDVITNGYDRERVFYDGSRALGIVTGTEYRNASMRTTWYLQVRGTF